MVRTWRWCKVFALFGEAVDVGEVCSGEDDRGSAREGASC